ncbi:hypothetical protein BOTBODRAFT_217749 [Botryobasidium botryosum FD-172 SS1]|uniref:Uncharacterized protein n=1 Tax=Botryobasidium botryosum (strain FD-172 SS1) TaxID=930990 RepID=A0A067NCU4_BOTB1|nr:hypothetical protein BOTBODRAFT_217749 [Botryobasidium botryosum FD-172 SS1]
MSCYPSLIQTRRNLLIPINRLPDELLSLVFELAASDSTYRPDVRTHIQLIVSGVSKHWRGVALNTPDLWTAVNKFNRPLAHLFVTRSKQAQLDIHCHSPHESVIAYHDPTLSPQPIPHSGAGFVHFITPFLPHSNRWRSLRISGVKRSELEVLSPLQAPELQHLWISSFLETSSTASLSEPNVSLTLFSGSPHAFAICVYADCVNPLHGSAVPVSRR